MNERIESVRASHLSATALAGVTRSTPEALAGASLAFGELLQRSQQALVPPWKMASAAATTRREAAPSRDASASPSPSSARGTASESRDARTDKKSAEPAVAASGTARQMAREEPVPNGRASASTRPPLEATTKAAPRPSDTSPKPGDGRAEPATQAEGQAEPVARQGEAEQPFGPAAKVEATASEPPQAAPRSVQNEAASDGTTKDVDPLAAQVLTPNDEAAAQWASSSLVAGASLPASMAAPGADALERADAMLLAEPKPLSAAQSASSAQAHLTATWAASAQNDAFAQEATAAVAADQASSGAWHAQDVAAVPFVSNTTTPAQGDEGALVLDAAIGAQDNGPVAQNQAADGASSSLPSLLAAEVNPSDEGQSEAPAKAADGAEPTPTARTALSSQALAPGQALAPQTPAKPVETPTDRSAVSPLAPVAALGVEATEAVLDDGSPVDGRESSETPWTTSALWPLAALADTFATPPADNSVDRDAAADEAATHKSSRLPSGIAAWRADETTQAVGDVAQAVAPHAFEPTAGAQPMSAARSEALVQSSLRPVPAQPADEAEAALAIDDEAALDAMAAAFDSSAQTLFVSAPSRQETSADAALQLGYAQAVLPGLIEYEVADAERVRPSDEVSLDARADDDGVGSATVLADVPEFLQAFSWPVATEFQGSAEPNDERAPEALVDVAAAQAVAPTPTETSVSSVATPHASADDADEPVASVEASAPAPGDAPAAMGAHVAAAPGHSLRTDAAGTDAAPAPSVPQSQVSEELAHAVGLGNRNIRLKLAPPGVGALDVDVRVVQGRVQLRVAGDAEQLASALRAQTHSLQESLRAQGLQLESVDYREQSASDQQSASSQQRREEHESSRDARAFERLFGGPLPSASLAEAAVVAPRLQDGHVIYVTA